MNIIQINETSVLVEFGKTINENIHRKVKAFCEYLDKYPFMGMIEYIPAFSSVSVVYNPMKIKYEKIYSLLSEILCNLNSSTEEKRVVKIPVCYGGKFGPDIQYVADYNKISVEEVIKIHSSGEYLVYMIGFAPGFPYLGGMSDKIATPRRKSPRTSIPRGAVGIAGMQTGVYPISTPGGWQLIGSTPQQLFRPEEYPPSLLKSGDIVKFYPISFDEYEKYGEVVK
ncbi:5-oxoprolinase subunit PxpB [Clostridium sp.]|jgi:inhibitor of KinA|uniref:5-oxoprolinase subunit PxpB n=1 Tax=Clostridium sp. TaxID=1506 RepID=UPI00258E8B81|nr:5-oxoprolinase subunit PxpB [Clostridium sp.]MDF2505990.1 kipI [Clostridium sp.]